MLSGAIYRDQQPIIARVWRANSVLTRARGLLARRRLSPGQGMWLVPCAGIHTLGMHYAIDVIHLDRAGAIVALKSNVNPFSFSWNKHSFSTVELVRGEIAELGLKLGDQLSWISDSK